MRFGRLGRFDFLTMLGKLGIAPVQPGSAYLWHDASGPLAGAKLLLLGDADAKVPARQLDAQLEDLDKHLKVGMQTLEDALCNWQKIREIHFVPRIALPSGDCVQTYRRLNRFNRLWGETIMMLKLANNDPRRNSFLHSKARLFFTDAPSCSNSIFELGGINSIEANSFASFSASAVTSEPSSRNRAFFPCSSKCAASWRKVNQKWSSER